MLDEPDQLAGGAVRDPGGAGIHDGKRLLIGDERMFHPPFGCGLPGGRRESGRKISTCAGQTLDVGQASTRLAEVTHRQFGGRRGRGQSAAGEQFDA